MDVKKGDKFVWDVPGGLMLQVDVAMVADDQSWVYIIVHTPGQDPYGKRMPLPFPDTFIKEE